MVERCQESTVFLACMVQFDDARIKHAAAGIDFLFFRSHHNAEKFFVEFECHSFPPIVLISLL